MFFKDFLLSDQVRCNNALFEKELIEVFARESFPQTHLKCSIVPVDGESARESGEQFVQLRVVGHDFDCLRSGTYNVNGSGVNEISLLLYAEMRADFLHFIEKVAC